MVARFDVALSLFKKSEAIFNDAFLPELLAELPGKVVIAAEYTVVKEGGSGDGISSCFRDALVDGAGGMPHFESKIEQGV